MRDEHKMFEKFGGGETSKQGQAVETLMSGKQCQLVSPGLKGRERFGCNDSKFAVQNMEAPDFSLDLLDVEGICPPI